MPGLLGYYNSKLFLGDEDIEDMSDDSDMIAFDHSSERGSAFNRRKGAEKKILFGDTTLGATRFNKPSKGRKFKKFMRGRGSDYNIPNNYDLYSNFEEPFLVEKLNDTTINGDGLKRLMGKYLTRWGYSSLPFDSGLNSEEFEWELGDISQDMGNFSDWWLDMSGHAEMSGDEDDDDIDLYVEYEEDDTEIDDD